MWTSEFHKVFGKKGKKEINDRMTYLEQICCCDLTLFGLPKSLSNCPVNPTNDSRSVTLIQNFIDSLSLLQQEA